MRNPIIFLAAMMLMAYSVQGQNSQRTFFQNADQVFKAHVKNGAINYHTIQKDALFTGLIQSIATTDFEKLETKTQQAYLINAYNLLVINKVVIDGLTESVKDGRGFFDVKTSIVGGQKMSLNTLEKKHLLKAYGDPRLHFVLVCGAKDCPPITNFAYTPELLEQQLEAQTRSAINDPAFIRINQATQKASLSQIFSWYAADFGGSKKAVLKFINAKRDKAIPADYSIDYYSYDWALNAQPSPSSAGATNASQGNNSSRYVVSAAIPKGSTETKIFNNLYTQKTRNSPDADFSSRSNFFTTSLSFLYGVSNRFNAGFDLRYRRVSNTDANTSPLNVLTNKAESRRHGITSVGPKIRWAPFENLSNLSVQSAFWIPIGKDLQGTQDQPYIDWDGATWNTQVFNDFSIGSRFSVFTELDFLLEDIGKTSDGDLNRFSTPATVILSFFPNPKTTLYALTNFSPYWQKDFDYFAQAGVGAKYQVTSNFEVEALYTGFTNKFLSSNNGQASTFNIGVRISR